MSRFRAHADHDEVAESPDRRRERDELEALTERRIARATAGGALAGRRVVARDDPDERDAISNEADPAEVPSSVNVRAPGAGFPDPRLLGARAYTLGSDVVLAGDVEPTTDEGREILGHELVHVGQAARRRDFVVRRYVAGDLTGMSIGPTYAQQLTEEGLEEDIAFLQQYRAGLDPKSIDREVADSNLHVLSAEADRRGYKSPSLTRGALLELYRSTVAELEHTIQVLPHLKDEFESFSWTVPWRPDPPAWRKDPIDFAYEQLRWMLTALMSGLAMIDQSKTVTDHDMSIALLRLSGVRVTSVMFGYAELRPFLYYLQAAIMTRYGGVNVAFLDPYYVALPVENARERITPDLAAFSQLELDSLDEVAASSAATTQELFAEIPDYIRHYQPAIELPQLPWQAEVLLILGAALFDLSASALPEEGGISMSIRGGLMPATVGGAGIGTIGTIVISEEQIATLRRLLAIGAISSSALAAAFGTSLAVGVDLPPAVVDLLGEGPTVDKMKVTGKSGAGMARKPRHHVMPKEQRPWFEDRGMKGDLDIDQFTVELDEAEHQALHGGGNWRLAREVWPGEWNQMIMKALDEAETRLGRTLRPNEILTIVADRMRAYDIPMDFVPYRGP